MDVSLTAHRWLRAATIIASLAVLHLAGCSTPPATFETPQAAVDSLVAALRANDQEQLKRVLGSDSDEVLYSGDEVADANGRADFLRQYDQKHELMSDAGATPPNNDVMTLEVGANDWPLPIPLVNDGSGWYFDTAAGLDELLSRRIGRNELSTIQVCLAVVDAQREYASQDFAGDGLLQYARRVNSDPDKKNGLFWPVGPGEPESPLGELIARAAAEGYTAERFVSPQPYHGYYYRILTEQGPAAPGGAMTYLAGEHMIGGFGVVAWPADYGNSGLKTFIVSHHGVVYERDLGDNTDRIARAMRAFNPEVGWEPSDTTEQIPPASPQ
jgi:hypothetical protein